MAIYTITENCNDDGESYAATTIFRTKKDALNQYLNSVASTIWDWNSCIEVIVSDIKTRGKDKVYATLNVTDTSFFFDDSDGTISDIKLDKLAYDKETRVYAAVPSNIKFTKKSIKDCIEKVKYMRDNDDWCVKYQPNIAKIWTDERLAQLVKDIFKYGDLSFKYKEYTTKDDEL